MKFETIDGTTLEGGGGLIRAALTYSSILNKPVHVFRVRANRPNTQGLQPGHTSAVHAIEKLTAAAVEGNRPYSPELTFIPHKNQDSDDWEPPAALEVDLEGSASIFLIAVLPCLLFSRLAAAARGKPSTQRETVATRLTIRAGMLVLNAPSIYYMRQVFLPTLKSIGITEEYVRLTDEYEQGWYNEGSCPINRPGKTVAIVKPLVAPLPGFIFPRRGPVRRVMATVHVPLRAQQIFKTRIETELAEVVPKESSNVEVIVEVIDSFPEDQYHLLLTAATSAPEAYLGYELIYPQEKRFPAHIKGDEEQIALHLTRACIRGLWKELRTGNSVDEHLEDILTVYATMATGFSSTVIKNAEEVPVEGFALDSAALSEESSIYDVDVSSIHRETSWWMAKRLSGVEREERTIDGSVRIGCNGLGLGA